MTRPQEVSGEASHSGFRLLGPAMNLLCVLMAIAVQPAQSQTFSILHTFTGGSDGGAPTGTLALDRGGHIYGTTSQGGNPDPVCDFVSCGTAFELSERNSHWTLTTLYSFFGRGDGGTPFAGVSIAPNGILYGTTFLGGSGSGIVYSLRPPTHTSANTRSGWIETPIYTFTGAGDGSGPGYGSLIFDLAGNVYGTTYQGGSPCGDGSCGTVFKLTPSGRNSWTATVYAFPGRDYGGNPLGGVVLDASGNLYGTTTNNNYAPVAYELTPSAPAWTETVLYTFPLDPTYPGGEGVILDGTGGLFGANLSAVHQLTPGGEQWNLNVLYNFTDEGGSWAPLVTDVNGNLYGTTCSGGTLGDGSVFKLSPSRSGWLETDLHDFTGMADGACPVGGVTLDAVGNIYGTAAWGAAGYGVVWKIAP